MAQQTTSNQKRGYIVIRTDASGYLNLNGGTNPANAAGETVSEMVISKAIWSNVSNNASWAIARGANTVWTCYGQTGSIDFQLEGTPIEVSTGDRTANVVFTLANGTGNLLLKIHKKGSVS
jgi:hypothetical protein